MGLFDRFKKGKNGESSKQQEAQTDEFEDISLGNLISSEPRIKSSPKEKITTADIERAVSEIPLTEPEKEALKPLEDAVIEAEQENKKIEKENEAYLSMMEEKQSRYVSSQSISSGTKKMAESFINETQGEMQAKKIQEFKNNTAVNILYNLALREDDDLYAWAKKSTPDKRAMVDKYNSIDNPNGIFDCSRMTVKLHDEPILKEYIFIPYLQALEKLGDNDFNGISKEILEIYDKYKKDDSMKKCEKMTVALGMLLRLGIIDKPDSIFLEYYDGFDMYMELNAMNMKVDPKFKNLFGQSKEQNTNVSMQAVVKNAIESGVTPEEVAKSSRTEEQAKEGKKGVSKDD